MPEAAAATDWAGLRARAAARVATIGLPTQAHEDWRYVDVAPLAKPPEHAPRGADAAAVAAHRVPGLPCVTLVDGAPVPSLSDRGGIGGVLVDDLWEQSDAVAWRARWSAEVDAADDATLCWSLADLAGAPRIRARGPGAALQILSLATGARSGARIVIEVAANAELRVVLSHVELQPSRSSIAIDVVLGANATLVVDELQYAVTGDAAQCFPSMHASVGRDARLTWTSVALGGGVVRLRSQVDLVERGAEATLAGVHVLDERRQAHTWLRLAHRVGDTNSRQVFKTVAGGRSRASFDGRVLIAHGADRANAEQINRNLLLSREARVDTRPQLDILDDDVKASHGATIGQISPDELFYLRARGIPAAVAQEALVRGFVDEVVAMLADAGARALAARRIGVRR
ncbi:MAG TPA: SufD family Fe-S cluster assembly protein [Planctomycetota bacterium]|nr:SufD family Fe-S cluster assembly protein [Planctomycetota bacterium]